MAGRRHRVSPRRSGYQASPWWFSLFSELRRSKRNSFINPARAVMTSNDVGISPVSFHDYPEYETPSQQYENGPITYFWGNYRPSKAVPHHLSVVPPIMYSYLIIPYVQIVDFCMIFACWVWFLRGKPLPGINLILKIMLLVGEIGFPRQIMDG